MPWRPGDRAKVEALEEPFDDVPAHLAEPLWMWVETWFRNDGDGNIVKSVGIRLRLAIPDPETFGKGVSIDAVRTEVNDRPVLLLEIVELLLAAFGDRYGWATQLEETLALGHSAYRVRSDYQGLEMRILPEVREQVAAVIEEATGVGSAAAHLTNAWNGAYGRTPDAVKAYSEAIKAVESAAAPIISPKNLKATLGTLIGDLAANATAYGFAIDSQGVDPVEVVLGMMRLLWTGQTSRHGGVSPTPPETPEAARAAVHVAATLVQWFVSGGIARR